MKNIVKAISAISFLLFTIITVVNANEEKSVTLSSAEESTKVVVTLEQAKKYSMKTEHAKLSLECVFCHVDQGEDASNFEAPEEDACLSCHKSKQYLAERLSFMDTHKANPHNSIHDGPNLYCDECHREHKPSVNMCSECHEKEIKNNLWMKETP
ncbi:MAG: hypothetical protein ACJAWW_002434 [Sulfurimonas sp.]|jgi:hypothetical protein